MYILNGKKKVLHTISLKREERYYFITNKILGIMAIRQVGMTQELQNNIIS